MFKERLKLESGTAYFTGPELVIKGALESPGGVSLLTGHPAWPMTGVFTSLREVQEQLLSEAVTVRVGHSPSQAVALLSGARMQGRSGVCVIAGQSADQVLPEILRLLAAPVRPDAAAVVVLGDWPVPVQPDPGLGADSRTAALRAGLALLEPSSPQEIKDWTALAIKISRESGQAIGLRLAIGEALSGAVQCHPNHFPRPAEENARPAAPAPATPVGSDRQTGLARVLAMAKAAGVNTFFDRPQKDEVVPLGFIGVGWAYAPLAHALEDLGLTGRFPVMKMGLVHPLDPAMVLEFASKVSKLVVVEQGAAIAAHQIIDLLRDDNKPGKTQAQVIAWNAQQMPDSRQWLHPSWLTQRMSPLLRDHPLLAIDVTQGRLNAELDRIAETSGLRAPLSLRSPSFCAGCPHRETSEMLVEVKRDFADARYMVQRHKRQVVHVNVFGSDGCMTLARNQPFESLNLSLIGPGVALAKPADQPGQVSQRLVVLMGDGAFFREGATTVVDAIHSGDDVTFIITDNKIAAGAGLAPHAGTADPSSPKDKSAVGIESAIEGLMPRKPKADVKIVRFNPSDRSRYRKLLESSLLEPGIKVLIADKECGLTFYRREFQAQRQTIAESGFLPTQRHIHIATEVCEFCGECTSRTGCPGLTVVQTRQGPKVQTDRSDCVNDGACHRLNACPAFEEVVVHRDRPSYHAEEHIDLEFLPQPTGFLHASQDTWRVAVAGVGGTGVTIISQILARAGHAMGFRVQVLESREPALRTSSALARVLFSSAASRIALRAPWQIMETGVGRPVSAGDIDPMGPWVSPDIPYGKSDLILGLDLAEAAALIAPEAGVRAATPLRTGAVVDGQPHPAAHAPTSHQDLDPTDLLTALRQALHPSHFYSPAFSGVCERIFGHRRYTNTAMIGYAFQKGLIPVTLDALEQAVREVIPQDSQRNIKALAIGRKMAVNPDEFILQTPPARTTPAKALRHRVNLLRVHFGAGKKAKAASKQFRIVTRQAKRLMPNLTRHPDILHDVIVRLHDCILWAGADYARDYLTRVAEVYSKDASDMHYALTRAAVWNLARVMLIKDEVYVATLLTHPEKYRMDRKRFGVNPTRGDSITYRHFNRPEIRLLGMRLTFSWQTRDWQLRLLRNMQFLRKLPGWHPEQTQFRDWYQTILQSIDWHPGHGEKAYHRWLAAITRPQTVTGFKNVRLARMEAARYRIEQILGTPSDQFTPTADDLPDALSGFGPDPDRKPVEAETSQTIIRPRSALRLSLPIL